MKHNWRRAIACFLALVLVAVLGFGCGDDDEGEGETTIVVGLMTDITGPGGAQLGLCQHSIEDLARYINEEDPIPGAKIRIKTFDNKYDPSRDIPGYEWLRGQGAKVILTPLPETAEILKPFAERDKVPIFTWPANEAIVEPPGWVFCVNAHVDSKAVTLMKWLGEQWPNYPTIPKIGYVGWSMVSEFLIVEAMEEYCQANPGEFEWVGGYNTPTGTMTWSGEIEALKECDYLYIGGATYANALFVKEFRLRGYEATFICAEMMSIGKGTFLDACGWDAVDGTIEMMGSRWWNEAYPIPELANDLVRKYHPGKAEDIIHMGLMYIGTFHGAHVFYDILRQAIEEVGAENFDGQAFYDTAIKFNKSYEGLFEYKFTETARVSMKDQAIYEWSADEGDLVRLTDWLPLID